MLDTAEINLEDTRHMYSRKGIRLPLRVMELAYGDDFAEVLIFGEIAAGCLVRIHSRCLFGDVIGTDDCDCGPQLDKALDKIFDNGGGVLIYLHQEGRGAGLIAKARGLRLSEAVDYDTFTAYCALGYPPDNRSYILAAIALDKLSAYLPQPLAAIGLLTNNPEKEAALATGRRVTVIPLWTRARTERERRYLAAKVRRGHLNPPPELTEPGSGGRPGLQLLGPLALATVLVAGTHYGLRPRPARAEHPTAKAAERMRALLDSAVDLLTPLPLPEAFPTPA
ncbi:GTP cyclohydrolase [Nocardia terpenica]|nr:GTP cyclohydrolase [Nocardia terpenica]NQE92371.1 GTP cyclohydrolase [Nocardia terpenica]